MFKFLKLFFKGYFIGYGFNSNSINCTSFRRNSITSYQKENNIYQATSFYNKEGYIVVALRKNKGRWHKKITKFKNKIDDAHNSISLIFDGDGFLHMVWANHNNSLSYARSKSILSLDLKKETIAYEIHESVTYPEFYLQPSGNLILLYRNGISANGNLVVMMYKTKEKKWECIHKNLIDGENNKSPYWQACVDKLGCLHISWCWRFSTDVSSNSDICYIKSTNEWCTNFVNSSNLELKIPIIKNTSTPIVEIPQNSMLINQTSMTTDNDNNPYIVSYWKINNLVQYMILVKKGVKWSVYDSKMRKNSFTAIGKGTKHLPCSRPQIFVLENTIYLLIRDKEFDNKLSMAEITINNNNITIHKILELFPYPLGSYEPTFNLLSINSKNILYILVQNTKYGEDNKSIKKSQSPIFIVDKVL